MYKVKKKGGKKGRWGLLTEKGKKKRLMAKTDKFPWFIYNFFLNGLNLEIRMFKIITLVHL